CTGGWSRWGSAAAWAPPRAGPPLVAPHLPRGTAAPPGAAALLGGQPLTHLTSLDLRHHYLGDPLMERLRELCGRSGTRLDLDEADSWDPADDEPRYVAVSE
ncbi:leucine-rich repeat domain-containing protein, partial [Streptomyces sp. NPDC059814]